MTELTRRDRGQAMARLAEIEDELGLICTWLSLRDEDKVASLLEDATRSVMAACWALERPGADPSRGLAERLPGTAPIRG